MTDCRIPDDREKKPEKWIKDENDETNIDDGAYGVDDVLFFRRFKLWNDHAYRIWDF